MASLVVKSEQMPLQINLSAIATMSKLSDCQFYDFCRTNPDLRIERNANGEIVVIPQHLLILATVTAEFSGSFMSGRKRMQLEKHLILVRALPYQMVRLAPESVSCEPKMPMFALKMEKIW